MFKSFPLIFSLALVGCSASTPIVKNVQAPKILHMVKPAYPYYAVKNRVEGKVSFVYDVDAEGKVSEMRIIESTPDHLFDDTVIRAVSQWRFEKGHPTKNIAMRIVMRVNQTLN